MTPLWLGSLMLVGLLATTVAGIPVAVCCALVGIIGLWISGGFAVMFSSVSTIPFSSVTSYTLVVLPLFILMGNFAEAGGYVHELFRAARAWLGSIRGSLGLATMLTCAALGAISGSTLASIALMSKIAFPEMRKAGYDQSTSAGAVCMGGTLAHLIPPSLGLVIYATLADASIGKLLIAGILPGIMTCLVWMATIFGMSLIWPKSYPQIVTHYTFKEKVWYLGNCWPVIFLVLLVLGGLYLGFFTATEAAAVGVFGTFLLLFLRTRNPSKVVKTAVLDTSRTAGAIMIIIACAMMFAVAITRSGFTVELTTWFASLQVSRYIVISLFMILYVILGTFMDGIGMQAITVPILLPVVVGLGFDPVWWGIMVMKGTEIGLATPPFGLGVFTVKSVVPDLSLPDIFRGTIPFLLAEIPQIALLMIFPQIALFLPEKMIG